MNLNPFRTSGKRRQTPAEVRSERDRLAADKGALAAELAAARQEIGTLTQERDWFHDHWVIVGHRDIDSRQVVDCLSGQLEAALKKVTDLEAIAGPHVDSSTAPEPLFAAVAERRDGEVTREFRVLTAGPGPEPAPEPIGPMTLVKPLARAVGGVA